MSTTFALRLRLVRRKEKWIEEKITGNEKQDRKKRKQLSFYSVWYIKKERKYLIRQLPFYPFIILLNFKNMDNMVILH